MLERTKWKAEIRRGSQLWRPRVPASGQQVEGAWQPVSPWSLKRGHQAMSTPANSSANWEVTGEGEAPPCDISCGHRLVLDLMGDLRENGCVQNTLQFTNYKARSPDVRAVLRNVK